MSVKAYGRCCLNLRIHLWHSVMESCAFEMGINSKFWLFFQIFGIPTDETVTTRLISIKPL